MELSHILVASDLSDLAHGAYRYAAAIANASGAAVTVLHADELASTHFADLAGFARYRGQIQDQLHDRIGHVAGELRELGVEAKFKVLPGPARGVIDAFLREVPTDLVVMARPIHHDLIDRLLGSTTTGVLRLSDVPVLVVPVREDDEPGDAPSLLRVAVTTDFSVQSRKGLHYAAGLAALLGASAEVLHAVDTAALTPSFASGVRVEANKAEIDSVLEQNKALLRRHIADSGEDLDGSVIVGHGAAAAIVESASDRGTDLLIIPSTGKGTLARLMMGSTSERVVSTAPMPVLVLPPHSLDSYQLKPVTADEPAEEAAAGLDPLATPA